MTGAVHGDVCLDFCVPRPSNFIASRILNGGEDFKCGLIRRCGSFVLELVHSKMGLNAAADVKCGVMGGVVRRFSAM